MNNRRAVHKMTPNFTREVRKVKRSLPLILEYAPKTEDDSVFVKLGCQLKRCWHCMQCDSVIEG